MGTEGGHPYRTATLTPPVRHVPPLWARIARVLGGSEWASVRRALGGHWEWRLLDNVFSMGGAGWVRVDRCTALPGTVRQALTDCEDWPLPADEVPRG